LPRGSTVLNNSGHHARAAVNMAEYERTVQLLAGRVPAAGDAPTAMLETGIKVIDVMCPLVAGGAVAIAGDWARARNSAQVCRTAPAPCSRALFLIGCLIPSD
jgi:hypothetical protein